MHAGAVIPSIEIPVLVRQLRQARHNLATDMPSSPAWTATVEWVDELVGQARAMGLDPDDLVEQTRQRAPAPSAFCIGNLPR